MGRDDAKAKIFQAARELVAEGKPEHQITVREIASRAGVNLALVNYHYQSKENLLSQVVARMMTDIIAQSSQSAPSDFDAVSRLRSMLLTTASAAFTYRTICSIAIASELKAGCENSCSLVLPLLRELLPGVGESELRIIALQLMIPFHHILLMPEFYNAYLQTDFYDEQKRSETINQMIDSLLASRIDVQHLLPKQRLAESDNAVLSKKSDASI